MQVLEVAHVLADHEQVITLVVNLFERRDSFTVPRISNGERHLEWTRGANGDRCGRELERVISRVEWIAEDERHLAFLALPRLRRRDVGMHGTEPCRALPVA